MAQIKSINRWGQKPSRNLIHSFSFEYTIPANRCGIRISSAIILLCWATTCFAGGSGPGIGIKVGAQTLDSPTDFNKTTQARFEVELASQRFGDDHFDLALTFGGSSFGSFHDEYAGFDDGVLIEEFYTDRYSLFDIRLAGRLYPLGDSGSSLTLGRASDTSGFLIHGNTSIMKPMKIHTFPTYSIHTLKAKRARIHWPTAFFPLSLRA